MFCPKINSGCRYQECPYYLPLEKDYCLDALHQKNDLSILSIEEKKALGHVRQKNYKGQLTPWNMADGTAY